jgi:hypothetical protein
MADYPNSHPSMTRVERRSRKEMTAVRHRSIVDAALEDDIEDRESRRRSSRRIQLHRFPTTIPKKIFIWRKRVTHRGDSTNREAKRAKFMVKIARLDEELQSSRWRPSWRRRTSGWHDQRLSTK